MNIANKITLSRIILAFIFMFLFVISINLFADKVRDVFDPRNG